MQLLHVGRSPECEIIISHDTVSRQHAQLFIEDDGSAHIIDLNSTNGTFVNGARIVGKRSLQPRDIVKVGEAMLPWENYVQVQEVRQPEVVTGTPVTTKERQIPWKWIGAAAVVGVVIILAIFLWPSSGGKLNGEWTQVDDSEAKIRFEDNGVYSEVYQGKAILDNAEWKLRGKDGLLIIRDGITITRRYELDGDNLEIIQDSVSTEYERSAR